MRYKILVIFLLIQVGCFSQSSCILEITGFEEEVALDSCWLFHPGDSSSWSSTDYEDHHWIKTSPLLDLPEADSLDFFPISWFRLNIHVDSTLTDKILAFDLKQTGASEIFLDGERIYKAGTIGSDTTIEKPWDPEGMPLLFRISEAGRHVIAVRYSNQRAYREYEIFNQDKAGFELSIVHAQAAVLATVYRVYPIYVIIFLMSVFVILGLLHFLLFLYYREKKNNLYYSLFSILFAGVIFIVYTSNSIVLNPLMESRSGFLVSLLVPFTMIPLIAFIHDILYKKLTTIFWMFCSAAVLVSLWYLLSFDYINTVYAIFFMLSFVEIIRGIAVALRKKKEGARVLGGGILLFILFFLTMILLIIFKGSFQVTGDNPFIWVIILLIIASILSIPISMSVYLARDFAVTNRDLIRQLKEVKRLSALTLQQEKEKQKILETEKERLEVMVRERTAELEEEKERTEGLLHNILPDKVVKELKEKGYTEPEYFENVTVYFSDVVGFTDMSGKLEPSLLIAELNDIFTAFDDIMTRNQCERIKTIGDAYLAVSGMPEQDPTHAGNIARSSLEILEYLEARNETSDIKWQIRIGIHSGKVVGSVVGVRKYIYDIFGDTINTAARMEQHSAPMKINVSPVTYELLKDNFTFSRRESIEIKGKGRMVTYFLEKANTRH